MEYRKIQPGQGHEEGRKLLAQMYLKETGNPMPEILTGHRGKPYFAEGNYHFSITHTRHHVFVVLKEHPVGIDAEEKDRKVDLHLAEKILSPNEKIRFEAAENKQEFLLKLWVLKEAAGKLTGEGINGYPTHTDFASDDPRVQEIDGCFVAMIED